MISRYRLLILLTILVLIVGAIFFAGHPPSSLGQIRPNWTPCGCFCGFKPPYPPVPPVAYVIFNKEPCTGILAADACRTDLSNLPADQDASVCEKVKVTNKSKSFKEFCPVFEEFCGPKSGQKKEPAPDCQKPTPWFDGSRKCNNIQSPKTAVVGG